MKFPAKDFESLRELFLRIKQGKLELEIGNKSLRAFGQMVHDPDIVAVNNIVELAKAVNLSPASLTRLAKLFGFSGFNQFQQVFKLRSKVASRYYSSRASDLVNNDELSAKQVMQQQLATTVENMQSLIEDISQQDIDFAVRLLARARRVFIFGHKQASAMANVLRYGLCLIRRNVQNLTQYDHGLAVALGQLEANDLVVIFSSSPYSNLSVEIVTMAKQLDCQILSITDSSLSPLNEFATVSIQIPTDGHFYTNSLAANVIVLESLLSLTAIELGPLAIKKLQNYEDLSSQVHSNA